MPHRKPPIKVNLFSLLFTVASLWILYYFGRPIWAPVYSKLTRPHRTVDEVLALYGSAVEARLGPYFDDAHVPFPPRRLALLAFKEEKSVELWAQDGGPWRLIKAYPILGASGTAGPKLREGDRQVPEGIYHLDGLNPNSRRHLSMRVNYPNDYDCARATEEGRTNLGGEIFIHGHNTSIGCIAIGDKAIEEIFVVAARSGWEKVPVIIAPNDFRKRPPNLLDVDKPSWLTNLYNEIELALKSYETATPGHAST